MRQVVDTQRCEHCGRSLRHIVWRVSGRILCSACMLHATTRRP